MSTARIVLILAGCALAAPAQPSDTAFERFEIVTGAATERQTVLTGFFLDRTVAQVAVVSTDSRGARRLTLYALETTGDRGRAWGPVLEAKLGAGVDFVDVAAAGGRDRLITFERGRLSWFDPESSIERLLVEVGTEYSARHDHEGSPAQPPGDPPRVDITRDLNGDGRDDLVVPDFDGFWIAMQRPDGSFADAVKLGPSEPFLNEPVGNLNPGGGASDGALTYRDVGITAATVPLYLSRVHAMDYDHDGASDLVFWNRDHFEVHLQNEEGLFGSVPVTFAPGVPFDSEGVYSRAFDFRGQGVASILFGIGKRTEKTVLHSLRDLDGDGVGDLTTLTLTGRGATRQRSLYRVHFGAPAGGKTVFAPSPGAVIRPRGKGGALQPWGYAQQSFADCDADGRLESVFQEVNVGLGGMAHALIGKSVPMQLEVYPTSRAADPEEPAFRKKLRRFAPFSGWSNIFFPPVLLGDVDGDGRSDLVVGRSPKELSVYSGVSGPGLFSDRPVEVAVALPRDERRTWLVDLDRDGKRDVLVHRTPTGRSPDAEHRVTTLIAR